VLTDAARERLVKVGYDPAFGARPLKRAIQKEVETTLARKLVSGEIRDGQKVIVDEHDREMVIDVESAKHADASK
jgi:ATP-dependent Clp protease ATP-binding subunit ClpB